MGKYVHPDTLNFWANKKLSDGSANSRGIPDQTPVESITVEEAAAQLRICPQTIRRYIQQGKLIAWDIGNYYRIPLEEWQAFLDRCLTVQVDSGWLSSQDVMRLLDIRATKFYALIESGELPSYRIGGRIRVKREELAAWIHKQQTAKSANRRVQHRG